MSVVVFVDDGEDFFFFWVGGSLGSLVVYFNKESEGRFASTPKDTVAPQWVLRIGVSAGWSSIIVSGYLM